MTRLLPPLLALVLLSVQPLAGGDVVLMRGSGGAAGCNAVTETTWDNLTGWTQDTQNIFTADATNDELDIGNAGGQSNWLVNDTGTANNNHCGCLRASSAPTRQAVILRGSSTTNDQVYTVGWYTQWTANQETVGGNNLTWNGSIANWGTTPGYDQNDSFCACVTGTGASTVIELWHFNESLPSGNCPADWGTPTFSDTDCGGACVNADQRLVGVAAWDGANAQSVDDYLRGDND